MKARPPSTIGLLSTCIISALMVFAIDAKGQQPAVRSAFEGRIVPVVVSPSQEPDTYGTASQTAMMIGSFMFEGRTSTTTIEVAAGIERFLPNGSAEAHPVLPNGALIEKIELRACDSSDTAAVTLFLGTCDTPGVGCTGVDAVTTGVAATPGCGNFALTLASAVQVNNQNPIVVEVQTGPSSATSFSGVKIYYRLQVSPAPAVATFSDVPTSHPFFKFVEALAAAGITAGCGGGNYCPDSPLTRGQMAVFLSVALGLHWPN